MIVTYYEQLKQLATETGWDLKEACLDAKIALTTYHRWTNKNYSPREKQAKAVAEHMLKYRK